MKINLTCSIEYGYYDEVIDGTCIPYHGVNRGLQIIIAVF